jgi:hypothetical protein
MNMFTIHNFMRLKVVLALMHWFPSFSTPGRTISDWNYWGSVPFFCSSKSSVLREAVSEIRLKHDDAQPKELPAPLRLRTRRGVRPCCT